jgi:hypothetical protein
MECSGLKELGMREGRVDWNPKRFQATAHQETTCVLECSGLTELWMRGPHRLKSKAVSSHCTKMPASDRTRTRIYDTLDGWLNRWKKDGRKLRQIFGPQPKALSLDLLVSYFHYR